MSRVNANLLLMLIALIWGSAFVAQSRGMAHMGPMAFTGVRFMLGALVVTPLMWLEWRSLQRRGKTLHRLDGLKIAGLGTLLALGAAMQQIGIVSTSITNAGFLTALYVPLVPVLGWLLWRQLPHWSVCLLALAWTAAWEPVSWAGLQAAAWPLVYTGVMSVGVAFTAQVVAQRYAHATDAAIVLSSETLFAAGFGYVLMGERLDAAGLAGCGLIFISMMGVQLLPLLRQNRTSIVVHQQV